MTLRKQGSEAPFRYRYTPVSTTASEPSAAGPSSSALDDDHYPGFERQAIASSRKASRYSRLALESDESDANSATSGSSGSEKEDEAESSAAATAIVTESFAKGDAVYIQSNIAHPHLGVLTDVFVRDDDDDDNDGSDVQSNESAQLYCTVRFLYWPRDVSQVTSKKLDRLIDEDEIYYTHQAPKLGRRRTKNSLRGGDAIVDNFQHGPSLLYMTVPVTDIIGKVTIHGTPSACREAAKQANRSGGAMFKRKRWPQHLYVQRAIDPQREVFWRVDWDLVAQRGVQKGKWDLVEGDDDVRSAQQEQAKKVSEAMPLSSPGKNADEWARILSKERGIPLREAVDREAIRKRKEAARIAALLDTPSQRKKALKAARSAGRHAPSSDDESSSDESDDSTAMTSDEEYIEKRRTGAHDISDEEDEEMLSPDEADDDLLVASKHTQLGPKKRKRGRPRKYDVAPVTPSKRRALQGFDMSPVKALVTPRSKARILGTVAKAPTSLPARPVPLAAMPSAILDSLSPQERAKRLLHVGATPESLPCRSEQYEEVMACLEDAVEEGLGGCVYVSGVPGTGKTATVREVIRALQRRAEFNEVSPFNFVEINGMKLQDAHDTYGVLWHALTGMRCSNSIALHHLGQHFGKRGGERNNSMAGPGRATTIVLMDELDQLVTARQDVMYNMFNWPNGLDSRLIVVAIANTMDLPERVLHPKVASRLGMTRITFRPYSDKQLVEIVHARLGVKAASTGTEDKEATRGCDAVFAPDALVYLAKRISNVSGDARRMLDVSRRAIDAVEDILSSTNTTAPRPVTIADVKRVLDAMVKSGKGAHIARLSLQAKVALMAVLASVRRSGLAEISLGDVTATYMSLCRMHAIDVPASIVSLLGPTARAAKSKPAVLAAATDIDDPAHLSRSARLLDSLCAMGLLMAVGTGTAGARSGQFARYMLGCSHDEVRLALEHDEDGRVRGMI